MNISYQKILNAIESFATAHMQVKRYSSDFPEQVPNFATIKENYPILYVAPYNAAFDLNANTFNLTIYCYDILEKDRSNVNSALSDTNQILNDLYRWFEDGDVSGIDVIDIKPTLLPINNALLDYAVGWEMTLTLVVGTYGICEIPFNPPPAPGPEGCDVATVRNSNDTYDTTVESGGLLILPDETIDVYVNAVYNSTGTYIPLSGQAINITAI